MSTPGIESKSPPPSNALLISSHIAAGPLGFAQHKLSAKPTMILLNMDVLLDQILSWLE
jgi:hypothetical protein